LILYSFFSSLKTERTARKTLHRTKMNRKQEPDAANRSFDCLLGKLYDKSASFDGLSGTEQNPDAHDSPILVWNSPGTAEATMRIPDPDPGELWTDINSQLFSNAAGPRPGQSPSMDGFVRNYLA
jgi:phospholipase C